MNIYLFGEVNAEMTSKVISSIVKTPPDELLRFVISSDGGELFQAISIINAFSDRKTEAVIIGNAFSAAALIAACCDTVKAFDHTLFMFHGCHCNGERDGITDMIDDEIIKNLPSKIDLTGFLGCNEYFFTAKDAYEFGLVDELLEGSTSDILNKFGVFMARKKIIDMKTVKFSNEDELEKKEDEKVECEESIEEVEEAVEEVNPPEVAEDSTDAELVETVMDVTAELRELKEAVAALSEIVHSIKETQDAQAVEYFENKRKAIVAVKKVVSSAPAATSKRVCSLNEMISFNKPNNKK